MAIENKSFYTRPTLLAAFDKAKSNGGRLHFLGLVSSDHPAVLRHKQLASYLGLLTPVFVTCSTRRGGRPGLTCHMQ